MKFVLFEGANVIMQPPRGMANCDALPVFRHDGRMVSAWKMTDEELEALRNGAHVCLTIHGAVHPPVSLHVQKMRELPSKDESPSEDVTTKYRKKPVVIDASQWFKNGDHPQDDVIPGEPVEGKVVRYFRHPSIPGGQACSKCGHAMHVHGWIDTFEDGHNVCPGDWIITGVKGERYPCKPDIFAATYNKVGS